ncbi:MAG: Gfo/Idh/MocA family oxidoreductase [Chloroflexota bacterium]
MPIRVGVIGARYAALVHIPALTSEGFTVQAICTRTAQSAQETARRFGIPNALMDYRALIARDDVDAVLVASPPALHAEMALAVLESGKHLLCEKPFTVTLEEARALRDAAAARPRVTAMVGHEFRFAPGRAYVGELVREGYLGSLHMALVRLINGGRFAWVGRAYNGDTDNAEEGGGLLWSQGSHYLDALMAWFGPIASVSAYTHVHLGQRTGPDGAPVQASADDAFACTFSFAAGGWASVVMSQAAALGDGGRIELYGSAGTLVTPQDANTPNPPAKGRVLGARVGEKALAELPVPERYAPFADERDMRMLPTRLLLREFARGIATGTSPSPNLEDAYQLERVLVAARESAATGRTVTLAHGG